MNLDSIPDIKDLPVFVDKYGLLYKSKAKNQTKSNLILSTGRFLHLAHTSNNLSQERIDAFNHKIESMKFNLDINSDYFEFLSEIYRIQTVGWASELNIVLKSCDYKANFNFISQLKKFIKDYPLIKDQSIIYQTKLEEEKYLSLIPV